MYRGAVESIWFAHVHAENIVEGEGYLEGTLPITPEERGESVCLPVTEAVAHLVPPTLLPADPNNEEGCLAMSEDGDHALFRLDNGMTSWDAEYRTRDLVWVGPESEQQIEVLKGAFRQEQLVKSLPGCREVPEDLKGLHTSEDMRRLWLHIPGHRPRWLWTSPVGAFDSASLATVEGVFFNPSGTHIYVWSRVEYEGPDENEWREEVTWHSLESLGLGACK